MKLFYLLILLTFFYLTAFSQNKENKVRLSPKAEIMQVVGFTEVRISYSRPAVKNREIWGKLVPYNIVWRAGANEATKFSFSSDVFIEGKLLKAGSYSFFVIPNKNEWTLIFNKIADQWGAFQYNESEDALRIKVKPKKINTFYEWLTYEITKISEYSATISLIWEKIKIEFNVETRG
jgi:hypothetical protein